MKKEFSFCSALCAILLGLCPNLAVGQGITFQKTYKATAVTDSHLEFANQVIETPQGYLMAGQSLKTDLNNDYDGLLLHIDKQGEVLWQKVYGGPLEDAFTSIVRANDGGYMVLGWLMDTVTNLSDIWVTKVDDSGNLLWQKVIGVYNRAEYPNGKIVPLNDGYVFAGTYGPTGWQSNYSILTHIDNAGNTRWAWSNYTTQPLSNVAYGVQFIHNDSIYLCGGSGNNYAFWMIRDTATGLSSIFGSYQSGNFEVLRDMHRTQSGGNIMSGTLSPQYFGAPISIAWAQYIPVLGGGTAWAKTYSVPGWKRHRAIMELWPDNTFLLSLSDTENGSILAKIGLDGQVIWAKSFLNSQYNYFGRPLATSDGGLMLVGSVVDEDSIYNGDIWVMKTDADGRSSNCCSIDRSIEVADYAVPILQNAIMYGGNAVFAQPGGITDSLRYLGLQAYDYCDLPRPQIGGDIALCPGDSVTLNGTTYTGADTVQFYLPAATGDCDTFALYHLSLLPQPTRTDTVLFAQGDTVFIGGLPYWQPGTVVDTLAASAGECDTVAVYVLDFKLSGTRAAQALADLHFFPNPTSPEAELRLEGRYFGRGQYLLLDLAGRLVAQGEVLGNRLALKNRGLPNGLYYVKVIENGRLAGAGRLVLTN